MLQCVAVCCSVLQCVVVCCSVLQCVVVCCSVLYCMLRVLHPYGVLCNSATSTYCCSVLQCVLQCVAVCCRKTLKESMRYHDQQVKQGYMETQNLSKQKNKSKNIFLDNTTLLNKSWHMCVIHMNESYVTFPNGSCVARMNESFVTCMNESYVTHTNESCHPCDTCDILTPYIQSYVTHPIFSHMSHICLSHSTHVICDMRGKKSHVT